MRNRDKLNVPAIKARIKELEIEIREGKQDWQRKAAKSGKYCGLSSPKDYVHSARCEATALYCLRAHMRGRLHMSRGEYEGFTLEQQAELFDYLLDDYVVEEETQEAA